MVTTTTAILPCEIEVRDNVESRERGEWFVELALIKDGAPESITKSLINEMNNRYGRYIDKIYITTRIVTFYFTCSNLCYKV